MISPLFTTIVLCCAFIYIYMKITSKRIGSSTEAFLERENLANSTRRKSLDDLDYITITPADYPVLNPAPNSRISQLTDTLNELTNCKIVNLTGITNTDLKLSYGPANLQILTEYDQNFTKLCRTLYDFGVELTSLNLIEDAVKAYTLGINVGTDISGNYINLANIYVENGNYDGINWLISCAQSIRSLTKNTTIRKLQEILDTHTTLVVTHPSDSSNDDPGNILPADILDILETVPYKSDDQM